MLGHLADEIVSTPGGLKLRIPAQCGIAPHSDGRVLADSEPHDSVE